ncbi:phenylalanine--tRNA ligase subunit alpha [Mesoplasma lactucae]|uniref:Phenylalanine--tRNA ligase alpha subunit n=1 Tax=Mesoplasma lactucae ATCC 49193 TaxID=81460 RepID=A0A291IRJ9_9MOLU|nr:phenylalanine--tRNA ligase subunit alpha [Mesoplasma lactucae]ATG97492.1 phenylalanine--tRNA ligase subunit alpha [Mesoplasma lactucae ATCC 49193]ATZ20053.1 phenylalanyl-tRNA synthetase subunit alpha [Mesoplasma lactucae ATCC 49193]MCL8216801.1 Phenylalanine--tRNA ligase alpha subunit [Mesoplasma lactucae ATCC 49193]
MKDKIQHILDGFNKEIKKVKTPNELEEVRRQFAGKNSPLVEILKGMKQATPEEKKEIGQLTNDARSEINSQINELNEQFQQEILNEKLKKEQVDVSLPGERLGFGTLHPLNLVIDEIANIFEELGFQMISGTEVDSDEFNFQKLNLPKGHPARDMQDTFYIDEDTVLRTHSTNMTSHLLTELSKNNGHNLACISYGNVYRRDDDDATHSHQFMQIDGFAVGDNITFANLKWLLTYMCQRLFDEKARVRFRPSYFPFTEPSVEADISCFKCDGEGCDLCKQSGWIEVLGAGLINDQVFEENGFDPKSISGLAFGIGIERIAMLKFGIANIRDFYENNVQFLEQFKFYGK